MQGTWNARPHSGSRRRSSPSRNSPRQTGQSVAPSMPAPYVAVPREGNGFDRGLIELLLLLLLVLVPTVDEAVDFLNDDEAMDVFGVRRHDGAALAVAGRRKQLHRRRLYCAPPRRPPASTVRIIHRPGSPSPSAGGTIPRTRVISSTTGVEADEAHATKRRR
uniref:Uncharacterized protein n=1 Tax=Oryza glumipatula TaxID=40148 RepID=A0A0D9YSS8_9ORYZ